MFRGIVLPASVAVVLSFTASALADGQRKPVRKDAERQRVEFRDRDLGLSYRERSSVQHRHRYRTAGYHHRHRYGHSGYRHRLYGDGGRYHLRHHGYVHRPWDGRYGHYPRRHFFVSGVQAHAFHGAVNVATVTYRTFVYYTPTYPSVSYGYPPYAHLYNLTAGPVYNKPCFC